MRRAVLRPSVNQDGCQTYGKEQPAGVSLPLVLRGDASGLVLNSVPQYSSMRLEEIIFQVICQVSTTEPTCSERRLLSCLASIFSDMRASPPPRQAVEVALMALIRTGTIYFCGEFCLSEMLSQHDKNAVSLAYIFTMSSLLQTMLSTVTCHCLVYMSKGDVAVVWTHLNFLLTHLAPDKKVASTAFLDNSWVGGIPNKSLTTPSPLNILSAPTKRRVLGTEALSPNGFLPMTSGECTSACNWRLSGGPFNVFTEHRESQGPLQREQLSRSYYHSPERHYYGRGLAEQRTNLSKSADFHILNKVKDPKAPMEEPKKRGETMSSWKKPFGRNSACHLCAALKPPKFVFDYYVCPSVCMHVVARVVGGSPRTSHPWPLWNFQLRPIMPPVILTLSCTGPRYVRRQRLR
ncbi:unnamed protein product [Schistocephalus solidus]|uniref:Stork_head domain-containing protein n=1 Tax=Schistocephalus solidus TaxID=70667 RepID=A0A183T6V1_SCHSO|nr:unnamed protein product [Schistocephalus solidus]